MASFAEIDPYSENLPEGYPLLTMETMADVYLLGLPLIEGRPKSLEDAFEAFGNMLCRLYTLRHIERREGFEFPEIFVYELLRTIQLVEFSQDEIIRELRRRGRWPI